MIAQLLEQATAGDLQTRRKALALLGDYLEYADWVPMEVSPTVQRLLERLHFENDPETLETLLNALVRAFSRGKTLDVSLTPLIEELDHLPVSLIEYGLEIIAQTHKREFRPIIERLGSHPSENVRKAAEEAMVELRGRG